MIKTFPDRSFDVIGFCRYYGISKYTFYQLQKTGKGPRLMRLAGNVVRVTPEAAQEWQAAMEDPANGDHAAQAERLRHHARIAAAGVAR